MPHKIFGDDMKSLKEQIEELVKGTTAPNVVYLSDVIKLLKQAKEEMKKLKLTKKRTNIILSGGCDDEGYYPFVDKYDLDMIYNEAIGDTLKILGSFKED